MTIRGPDVHYVDSESQCIPATLVREFNPAALHGDLVVYFKKATNTYRAIPHRAPGETKLVFTWHRIEECVR